MHGGVKFYRGSAAAARTYVEADRSRVDDYYLAEGTGVATRYVTGAGSVRIAGTLDGDGYEQWVAGYDVETGRPKGRLRTGEHGLRFVEVVVNGPKTWSLAALLHPAVAGAYDAAQERAAQEIIGWVAEHATTRIGPRGRQVQVPVDQVEAAVVRHYTSRAGDPHRHLHLQLNARVFAGGRWRGLHSVGIVDSIEAINGIGHAAVMCDPELRTTLAAHGYTLDPATGEVRELAPYAGAFSARAAQIGRNVDRYEAQWRREHPDQQPGPQLRRSWDRRAWAHARPDKVVPQSGEQLAARWVDELRDLGFAAPPRPAPLHPTAIARINRDAVTQLVVSRLGARRSSWNAADVRGEVERVIASVDVVTDPAVRRELAEDLTARTVATCRPLLDRADVPEHVRALTSRTVLEVEADLVDRLAARGLRPGRAATVGEVVAGIRLDDTQRRVAAALAGTARLTVVEGAAGAGKTTTLRATRELDRDAAPPPCRGHPDPQGRTGRRRPARHVGVLGRLAGPPARVPLGRRRLLVPRRLRAVRTRPTRPPHPGRPAARRRGRHARPGHRPRAPHDRRRSRRPRRARRRPSSAPCRRARRRPRPRQPVGGRGRPADARGRAPVRRPRLRRAHPPDAHRPAGRRGLRRPPRSAAQSSSTPPTSNASLPSPTSPLHHRATSSSPTPASRSPTSTQPSATGASPPAPSRPPITSPPAPGPGSPSATASAPAATTATSTSPTATSGPSPASRSTATSTSRAAAAAVPSTRRTPRPTSSSATPPPSTAPRVRPSTARTSSSARPPAPPLPTSP